MTNDEIGQGALEAVAEELAVAIPEEPSTVKETLSLENSDTAVLKLKTIGSNIDALKPIPVTRRARNMPLVGEWWSWSPDKLIAWLVLRMPYPMYLVISERVVRIMAELSLKPGEEINEDAIHSATALFMKAASMWAKEKTNT